MLFHHLGTRRQMLLLRFLIQGGLGGFHLGLRRLVAGHVGQAHQRLAQIGQLCLRQPGKDPGVVHGQLAGLPDKVLQARGEIHGVLAGA